MRIESISLTWFRGAAEKVSLDSQSKSVVAYGVNAAGKSSFVDAVEYILNAGRIGHLTHEYSGRHQEKGVINTHIPADQTTEFQIKFKDGSDLTAEIKKNGTSTISGAGIALTNVWDYRRTVLRQGEVSDFIQDTKGGKYSALLPLLGLHNMEVAAENIRQLTKSVEVHSNVRETRASLKQIDTRRKEVFGEDDDDKILEKIGELHIDCCKDKAETLDPITRCEEIKTALNDRIAQLSAEQKRYLILKDAGSLKLKDEIDAVREANSKLSEAVEPLITEKLEVLQTTSAFVDKLEDATEIKCPACGRLIAVEDFQAHVTAEKKRLQEIITIFDTRKTAIVTLCDTLKSLKSTLGKAEVKSWRDNLRKAKLADHFVCLDSLNAEDIRTSCSEDDLINFENKLLPLVAVAATDSKDSPPDIQQLSTAKQIVETGKAIIEADDLAKEVLRAESLISFLNMLEQSIREEIRTQSQDVIDELSSDIQTMWGILHPGEAIESVRLYVPKDTDKAIDIGLKFHGIEQDSPRLTLSEGYRNSLGLCIFLSMAKHEESQDCPLILDDVVISLDRGHRGMIVELLQKEFNDRQVIILTHDRVWYAELRQQLGGPDWVFKALMPYDNPKIGIRWSSKTSTFDDARAFLKAAPDSAANTARKIMDIELALRTERLRVKLPYLHLDRNDHRTAHEFLSALISTGTKCFKKEGAKSYESYEVAIEALREADKLILSWANRGSHTFDVEQKEAEKLIATCEKALEVFICPNCKKPVYKLVDEKAGLLQCQCGHLRWQYGKG